MLPAPGKRMTEDEYLAYDLAHERKAEFVNGETVDMAGVSPSVDAIVFVDSRSRMVQLQTRDADGTWTLSERTDGDLPLTTLGFSVPLAEIYEGVPG